MSDDQPSMFHDEHRALQDRFDGRRVADALEKHRRLTDLTDEHRAMIEEAPFFFLATAHDGSVDCSIKAGPPGFVRVTGPTELEWPDFDGNSMYRSMGNILGSPAVGLLFMRFDGKSTKLRVNGDARIVYDHPRLSAYPGAKMMICLTAREIFPNCPRGVPEMTTRALSDYMPEKDTPLPMPDWKTRDYIREILPKDDPHRT